MKRFRQYVREQIERDDEFSKELEQAGAEVRLAVALTHLRERRGLSQRDLARETGIKQPQIARLERGSQTPTLDTLARLLTVLDAMVEIGPNGTLNVHPVTRRTPRRRLIRRRLRRPAARVRAS